MRQMQTYSNGNHLRLLCNGAEFFSALIAAIERAQFSVFIETYIFADDDSGRAVAQALINAAIRGVHVQLVLDAFGSRHYLGKDLPRKLIEAGVQLVRYRPNISLVDLSVYRRTQLRRLHRKLALVDETIGFVGGINIIDDDNSPVLKPPRIDFAVEVRGPALAELAHSMHQLWGLMRVTNRILKPVPKLLVHYQNEGAQIAKLVLRDNFRNRRRIENSYLEAIADARHEVIIATAYFFPGQRFRRLIVDAAQQGIRVRILLQARIEYRLLNHATKALYGQLLAAGVELYEFHSSFLHAKVAVVDDHWATVGSSNIDPLSLLMAREANLVVHDLTFADELKTKIEGLIETGATRVTLADWQGRSLATRLTHWLAYAWARLLIGVFTFEGLGWLDDSSKNSSPLK